MLFWVIAAVLTLGASLAVLRGETVQLTASARTCAGSDTTVSVTYTGGNVDPDIHQRLVH